MKQQGSILTISMHQVLMLDSKLTQSMTKSKPSIIISHHATLNIQEAHINHTSALHMINNAITVVVKNIMQREMIGLNEFKSVAPTE
ncbi:hypothetical protein EB796_024963 [Bugula neritina]|uniref:Uncharacterized protein n=1 Tax=Bugula neritina TaxID=10212 RepID=A0A7J7IU20_BUGNE|nr:hypothetical protein EB796_024963 [Bugula neritina]